MKGFWRGILLLAGTAGLVACQPTLNSDLPSGPDAYTRLGVTRADSVNALNLLQPRDQINVNVFQEADLSTQELTIDPSGNISLPLIGEVKAAGLSAAQLAREIERAYGESYLRDPRVNIVLVRSAPRVVAVEGEVEDPGVFEVQEGYTLLTALALAGSPTDTAKHDEVLVFRMMDGERYGGRFDLTDIRAGRAPDPIILSGDTIVVGYSAVRGVYLDFLRTAPILGAFARY
jgi:polysaccharide export outer membrane protein